MGTNELQRKGTYDQECQFRIFPTGITNASKTRVKFFLSAQKNKTTTGTTTKPIYILGTLGKILLFKCSFYHPLQSPWAYQPKIASFSEAFRFPREWLS